MAKYRTKLRTVEAVQVTAGMVEGTEPCPENTSRCGPFLEVPTITTPHYAEVGMWLVPDALGRTDGYGRMLYESPLREQTFERLYEPAEMGPGLAAWSAQA